MNRLRRELAPMTEAAWAAVDEEATRALTGFLAGRRLVDFDGPHGWELAAVATGRTEPGPDPADGVHAAVRGVRPLVELEARLELPRRELDVADRGGDPDLGAVTDAARRLAQAEDSVVFHGAGGGGVDGMVTASPHPPITIGDDYGEFPSLVAQAVARLREAGVGGPYAVALGPRCHTGVVQGTERGGYPVLEHLRLITGGPVLWAPALDGSLVVSQRGGDFTLTVGQDLAVGYRHHDAETVTLAIEETVTFANHAPEAAVVLRYPG